MATTTEAPAMDNQGEGNDPIGNNQMPNPGPDVGGDAPNEVELTLVHATTRIPALPATAGLSEQTRELVNDMLKHLHRHTSTTFLSISVPYTVQQAMDWSIEVAELGAYLRSYSGITDLDDKIIDIALEIVKSRIAAIHQGIVSAPVAEAAHPAALQPAQSIPAARHDESEAESAILPANSRASVRIDNVNELAQYGAAPEGVHDFLQIIRDRDADRMKAQIQAFVISQRRLGHTPTDFMVQFVTDYLGTDSLRQVDTVRKCHQDKPAQSTRLAASAIKTDMDAWDPFPVGTYKKEEGDRVLKAHAMFTDPSRIHRLAISYAFRIGDALNEAPPAREEYHRLRTSLSALLVAFAQYMCYNTGAYTTDMVLTNPDSRDIGTNHEPSPSNANRYNPIPIIDEPNTLPRQRRPPGIGYNTDTTIPPPPGLYEAQPPRIQFRQGDDRLPLVPDTNITCHIPPPASTSTIPSMSEVAATFPVATRGKYGQFPNAPKQYPLFFYHFGYAQRPASNSPQPSVADLRPLDTEDVRRRIDIKFVDPKSYLQSGQDFRQWVKRVFERATNNDIIFDARSDIKATHMYGLLSDTVQDIMYHNIIKTPADDYVAEHSLVRNILRLPGGLQWREFNLESLCSRQRDSPHE